MPVQFHCSQCRRTLSVGQRKAGATVACPKCGAPNVVPRLEPTSAAPAATTPPPSGLAPAPPELTLSNFAWLPEAVAFDEIPNLIALIDSMPIAPTSARDPQGATPADHAAEPLAAVAPVAAKSPVISPAPPPAMAPPPIISSPAPFDSRPLAGAQASLGPPAKVAATVRRGRRGRGDDTLLLVSRKAIYAQAALMAVVALAALAAGYVIGRGGPRTPGDSEPASASEPAGLEQTE